MTRSEVDLRWFYCESESALGLRSNFGAIMAALETGVSGGWTAEGAAAQADARMGAAARWRRIAERLRAIGQRRERVLRRAFVAHRFKGIERWGHLGGVALLTGRLKGLAKADGVSPLTMLRRLELSDGVAAMGDIRTEAERILRDAMRAYDDR